MDDAANDPRLSCTTADELPALDATKPGAPRWDGCHGLKLVETLAESCLDGQPVLRLRVAPTDGYHRIGIAFHGLEPGRVYRVSARLRTEWAGRIMLDARDGTGAPSVFASPGIGDDGTSDQVAARSHDGGVRATWLRPAVDVLSRDGTLVVYVCLADTSGSPQFRGDGVQGLLFGGVQLACLADCRRGARSAAEGAHTAGIDLPVVFLHIGIPKTATTSIQGSFTLNRDRLLEQGVLYPTSMGRHDGHSLLHRPLVAGLEPESVPWLAFMTSDFHDRQLLARLRAEIAGTGACKIVMSAECLTFMRDPARLRAALEPYPVRILVHLRRQDSILDSLYNQVVKSRLYAESFDSFLLNGTSDPDRPERYAPDLSFCDYAALLARWAAAFGKENVLVSVYEDFRSPDAVWHDVADKIGFDTAPLKPLPARLNQRLPMSLVAVKRRMNALLAGEEARIVSEELVSVAAEASSGADTAGEKALATPIALAEALARRRAILEPYLTGNDSIARDYFPDRPTLFPEPSLADGLITDAGERLPERLLLETAVRLLSDVIQRCQRAA